MKSCSQAIANYFLDLAKEEEKELTPLKTMKLVYLVQGFHLAFHDKTALNPQFDVIEAWQYGPVIPALYHELKHFGKGTIKGKATIVNMKENEEGFDFDVKEAVLTDKKVKETTVFVWRSFKNYTANRLVDFSHTGGSPWSEVYRPYRNNVISDDLIKEYFKIFLKVVREKIKENAERD